MEKMENKTKEFVMTKDKETSTFINKMLLVKHRKVPSEA